MSDAKDVKPYANPNWDRRVPTLRRQSGRICTACHGLGYIKEKDDPQEDPMEEDDPSSDSDEEVPSPSQKLPSKGPFKTPLAQRHLSKKA